MHQVILSAREHHSVRSAEALRRAHASAIARRVRQGHRIAVEESAEPVPARINHGSWLVDCPCGAGCATDTEWRIACCFGCGTVHTVVVFPKDKNLAAIERLILARPRMQNRHWTPDESVKTVRAINAANGVKE